MAGTQLSQQHRTQLGDPDGESVPHDRNNAGLFQRPAYELASRDSSTSVTAVNSDANRARAVFQARMAPEEYGLPLIGIARPLVEDQL